MFGPIKYRFFVGGRNTMSSPKGRVGIVAVSGGNDSDRGQMFVEDYCDWIGIPAMVGKGISLQVLLPPRSWFTPLRIAFADSSPRLSLRMRFASRISLHLLMVTGPFPRAGR